MTASYEDIKQVAAMFEAAAVPQIKYSVLHKKAAEILYNHQRQRLVDLLASAPTDKAASDLARLDQWFAECERTGHYLMCM